MREPLLTENDKVFNKENRSDITRAYSAIIDEIYDGAIFPETNQYRKFFTKEESPLYISDREWIQENAIDNYTPLTEEKYEEYAHYLFWKTDSHKALTFVIGNVGCGKSTFIEYYLRSNCPCDEKNCYDFKNKIIIKINTRLIHDEEHFHSKFYSRTKDAILASCEEFSINIEEIIKQKSLNYYPSNNQEWVHIALKCISPKSNPYYVDENGVEQKSKYLVFFIDNIDQAAPVVQNRAISIIQEWLESGNEAFNVWKAYIPMWPSTLNRIITTFGKVLPYEAINLEPANAEKLIETRLKEANSKILKKEELDRKNTLRFILKNTKDIEECNKLFKTIKSITEKESLHDFISKITNSDKRRELIIWRDFICSSYISDTEHSLYNSYNAIITGRYEFYNWLHSGIMNIFDISRVEDSNHKNMIIGYHFLYLLSEKPRYKSIIQEKLHNFGYDASLIMDVFSEFYKFNFYHALPTQILYDKDEYIDLHGSVITTYEKFILMPAYIDNMAMVTPVKKELIDSKSMASTSPIKTNQFIRRTETSLLFIEQIKNDEIKSYNESTFIREYKIPFLYKKIVKEYYNRLIYLKGNFNFPGESNEWWNSIFSNTLFDDIRSG